MKLYNEMPTLEILAGDTLPAFTISVETISADGTTADADLTGCAMYLIVAQQGKELEPVITRLCDKTDTGFAVQLNSADTDGMSGMYGMHFALYSGENLIYKKIAGNLHVTAAATVLEDSGSTSLPTASDITLHLSDTTVHITAQERISWNACVDDLAVLQETVAALESEQAALAAETVTITRNEEFITGWNALHNYKDGNTLFINGNFKIGADIPGGTTLFALPYEVSWAYMLVKHGSNIFFAIAYGSTVYLPNSAEMLATTGTNATITGFARIMGAATAATSEEA